MNFIIVHIRNFDKFEFNVIAIKMDIAENDLDKII